MGIETHRGNSQDPVARMATPRENESPKPIDKAAFGAAASQQAVTQVNGDVASKVSMTGSRTFKNQVKAVDRGAI